MSNSSGRVMNLQTVPVTQRLRVAHAHATYSQFSPHTQLNFTEKLSLMRSSSLFEGLAQWECVEIASCSYLRAFARGEPLYAQGQPVKSLFLLKSGIVKETQVSADGNEALLRISAKSQVVGVHPEWRSRPHTCSARATEKSCAMVWEYLQIQRFAERFPQLEENMATILAVRLRDLEERFLELATEGVAMRLVQLLTRLSHQVGKSSANGKQISLSREELAGMMGATVFTVSRLLSVWASEGFIIARRESIIIPDARRLKAALEVPPRRS